jgi:Trk K+ transport system NAD-binding subunit
MTKGSKTRNQVVLWAGSVAVVLAIGVYYFPREYSNAGLWETLYCTLSLFVFEHDFSRFPGSWPLILIYFLAPLITLSAVGTVISYLFRFSPSLKTRWMSDHVVICGVGRVGKLFACTLKKKRVRVVGVDLGPRNDFDEWCDEQKVPVIFGDFNLRNVLEKTGAAKARSVIFCSGDDLANLEGALSAYEWLQTDEGPIRLIWAQIATEQLANTARAAVRTSGKVGIRFFDTYRIAAIRTIAELFNKAIRKEISEVTISGFGKFGRDLLEILVSDLGEDEKLKIRVIDIQELGSAVRSLAKELDVTDRVTFHKAAIQDMNLADELDKAIFICTDDDIGNLTATMSLARNVTTTRMYVRMNHWPLLAVAENLGEDRGVSFVNINDLVAQGIETLPGIFRSADASDLKRAKLGSPPTDH